MFSQLIQILYGS